jgi:hypothetical protein
MYWQAWMANISKGHIYETYITGNAEYGNCTSIHNYQALSGLTSTETYTSGKRTVTTVVSGITLYKQSTPFY